MITNGRGVGGGGNRFLFTPSQWQELEQQALIFKYMLSGVPVPPHLLLFSVRTKRSFGDLARPSSSSHFGWRCFEMGEKTNPEPGRCRRTDGKNWRCSKEAFQYSKYCEKHMHRGKNRSKKSVEQQQKPLINNASALTSDKHHSFLGLSSSNRYSNTIRGGPLVDEDDYSLQLTPLTVCTGNSNNTANHPYFDTRTCSKLGQGHQHHPMMSGSTRRDDSQQNPTVFKFLEGPPEKKLDSTIQ